MTDEQSKTVNLVETAIDGLTALAKKLIDRQNGKEDEDAGKKGKFYHSFLRFLIEFNIFQASFKKVINRLQVQLV